MAGFVAEGIAAGKRHDYHIYKFQARAFAKEMEKLKTTEQEAKGANDLPRGILKAGADFVGRLAGKPFSKRLSMKQKLGFVILLALLVFLTYNAVTIDRFGWDLTVTRWIQDAVAEEDIGPLPDLLFWMGLKGVAGAMIIAVACWLWVKRWRAEAFFLALVAIPDLFNVLLRYVIGRPRPTADLVNVIGGPQGSSFPSGYALHVMLFCGFIIWLSGLVIKPGILRSALRALLGLYIPVAGIWLIYDGRHWPSDVLGGYLYGTCYLLVLIWGYQKYTAWRRRYPAGEFPVEELPRLARPLAPIVKAIR